MMQKANRNKSLPLVVENFDKLPSEARIDSRALRLLLGINSYSTFSRRRKDGSIPAPDGAHGTWSVGLVRELLGSVGS